MAMFKFQMVHISAQHLPKAPKLNDLDSNIFMHGLWMEKNNKRIIQFHSRREWLARESSPLDRYNDPIGDYRSLFFILHPQDFIKNQSESLNFSEDIQQTLQLA